MRITLCDSRDLGVVLTQPSTDKFYNWTTEGWEQPFNPANHLRPLTPLEPSPSLFAAVIGADIGVALLERSDVALVVMTVDPASGAPIAAVDVWTLPTPTANPTVGGFTR